MTCFAKEAFRSWPACLPFWLPPGRGIQVSASGYGFCWRSEWRPGSTFPIIAVLPAPSRHFWRLRLRKQSLLPSSAGSGSSSSIRPRHAVKMNGAAPCTTPDTGGILLFRYSPAMAALHLPFLTAIAPPRKRFRTLPFLKEPEGCREDFFASYKINKRTFGIVPRHLGWSMKIPDVPAYIPFPIWACGKTPPRFLQ